MNHRELVEKLHGYHFGGLEDSERASVREHLERCAECRSLSETYLALRRVIEARRRSVGAHPTAEELVGFTLLAHQQDEESRRRIEEHLGDCSSCSDEVARIREAEASATEVEGTGSAGWASRTILRRPGGVYALAASLLAAALLYPAFLGLYRYPLLMGRTTELDRSLSETRARSEELGAALRKARSELEGAAAWSGAVDVVFLSSALRDEVAPAEVSIDPGKPHVVLGAEFDIPRRAGGTDRLRLKLTLEDGAAVADVEMSVEEAREAIRTAGVVPLLVPTARLAAGEYRLEVLYRRGEVDTQLLESPFKVARR